MKSIAEYFSEHGEEELAENILKGNPPPESRYHDLAKATQSGRTRCFPCAIIPLDSCLPTCLGPDLRPDMCSHLL